MIDMMYKEGETPPPPSFSFLPAPHPSQGGCTPALPNTEVEETDLEPGQSFRGRGPLRSVHRFRLCLAPPFCSDEAAPPCVVSSPLSLDLWALGGQVQALSFLP